MTTEESLSMSPADDDKPAAVDKYAERVLCVSRTLLCDVMGVESLFQGVLTDPNQLNRGGRLVLQSVLRPAHAKFIPRRNCEEDPRMKQIIPYVVVTHVYPWETHNLPSVVLRYNRPSKGQGENRLAGKASIGIGGHVNDEDHAGNAYDTFFKAMTREIQEELKIDSGYTTRVIGLINDDSDAVGSVHLGVLVELRVRVPCVYPNDPAIVQPHFVPVSRLFQAHAHDVHDEFESWSRLVLTSPPTIFRD